MVEEQIAIKGQSSGGATLWLIHFAITGMAILLGAQCERDDPNNPENPLNGRTTAVFNPERTYGTVSDVDGNIYKTIKIGSQTWLAENLRAIHFQNGDELPVV